MRVEDGEAEKLEDDAGVRWLEGTARARLSASFSCRVPTCPAFLRAPSPVPTLCPPQCFHAAGLPAGLLSVATGRGAEIGDFLTTHPDVNCISFTGGDTGEAARSRRRRRRGGRRRWRRGGGVGRR